jgi:peptidoglycan/LPS O-acetylase OafA/YrhL
MRDTTMMVGSSTAATEMYAGPPRIRWGAIFAGAVIGLSLLVVLTTLWFAMAYGSEMESVRDNLRWYVGGSAIAALLIGGIVAGYGSGVRGAGSGILHGITIWGLLLIVIVAVGIPSVNTIFSVGRVATQVTDQTAQGVVAAGSDTALWATFWSIVGGFVAASIGGAIGGAMARTRRPEAVTHSDRIDRAPVDPPSSRERTVVVDGDDDSRVTSSGEYRRS